MAKVRSFMIASNENHGNAPLFDFQTLWDSKDGGI